MRIRPHRALLSISIIAVTIWGISPSIVVTPSIDAVVNAEVVVVSSVIEGRMQDGPPRVGTYVREGQAVGRVENERQDRSFLGELQTERASLTERLAALDRLDSSLKRTAGVLTDRLGSHRTFELKRLGRAIAEATAEHAAVTARLDAAERDYSRTKALIAKGAVTRARHDEAKFSRQQLIAAQTAAIERVGILETRLAAVREGTFLTEGQNDVPYSQQRLDEITLRAFDIEAKRSEYAIRVAEIDRQLQTEASRLQASRTVEHVAPVTGIVWKRFVKPETNVVIGAELIEVADCRSAFLDVTLDEDSFPDVAVGQTATVRFVGENRLHDAHIRSIRGAGAVTEDRLLAARPQPRGPKEFQVIMDFDTAVAGATAENFCLIGRSAEVAFSKDRMNGLLGRVASVFGVTDALAVEIER